LPRKKNDRPLLCVSLSALFAVCLASCSTQPPPEPVLLTTSTYSDLETGQSIISPIEVSSQPVLVEILGGDTNFRSRVINLSGEVTSEVQLAFLRSAPVYHFIDAATKPSAVTLEITPVQASRLASVTVNLYQLSMDSRPDIALVSAWRNLARGLQFVDSEVAENWTNNLAALSAAGRGFERLGLNEPALWAQYFKAYFEYYPLYRYSESLTAATHLVQAASASDLPTLALLGHQLAGQIEIEREAGNDEEVARHKPQQAQEHFQAARQLATVLDNSFEIVWAINNSGIAFNYQDQVQLALESYSEALDLAIELEDRYLINLIGSNMAVSQEKQGHIKEAIRTLQRLQQEFTVQNDPLEREHILSLLGTYHFKLYQFPQALLVLNRALELSINQDWAENRGRNRLLLGYVYREMGQPGKSLANLEQAIPDLETARDGRGLRQALALSADIKRLDQRFDAMAHDRKQQEQYLATDSHRADWMASKARDAEAESKLELAIALYRQSGEIYDTTLFRQLGKLAELRACLLESRQSLQSACSTTQLEADYLAVQSLQASVPALEGQYLWAQLLAAQGDPTTARSVMADLVDGILFYRQSLPGVLGAWYWDARREIFDFYMDLVLESGANRDELARESWSALSRLRSAGLGETQEPSNAVADPGINDSYDDIRALMAQREQAETSEELEAAQRGLDQYLLINTQAGKPRQTRTDPATVQQQLRELSDDESVLTYFIASQQVYAWVGNKRGLTLQKLGRADEIRPLIEITKASIRTINHPALSSQLAELGELLITPIRSDLRFTIRFIGAGALSGFPLEALVVDGEPIIRQHSVVNVMTALGRDAPSANRGHPFEPHRIFLAGNPANPGSGLQELQGAAAELQAIQASFPGEDIALFEGADLIRAVFDSEAFSAADLVHIASHATIDLAYPELSRITLSGSVKSATEFLIPNDLTKTQTSAQLVVLSACSTVGLNRFEYDNNLGFVSEFLRHGSKHVMASLWPVADRATALFLTGFYHELAASSDVAGALRRTKLELIDTAQSSVSQWAAFQLFSR
jgi:CHAT domain-containing protein